MPQSPPVFELIKSLSSNEKRYFRLFCNLQDAKEGQKQYLQLFDFLEKQSHYDEQAIEITFAQQKLLDNLNATKNYLYRLVLKSLRAYYAKTHVDQIIGDTISNMMILEDRGLYSLAQQAMRKAKKVAAKHHRYYYLPFLLRKEAIYHCTLHEKKMRQRLGEIQTEMSNTLSALKHESDAFQLYLLAGLMQREGELQPTDLTTLLQSFESTSTSLAASTMVSFFTKISLLFVEATIAWEEQRLDDYYQSMQNLREEWQNEPHMIAAEPQLYRVHLANLLYATARVERYEVLPVIIDDMKNVLTRNFNDAAETFQNVTFYQLLFHLNTEDMTGVDKLLKSIDIGFKKYKAKINKARELSFYHNISVLHMKCGDIDRALFWLNKILHHPKTEHRKDVQRFAIILQCFYHYSLKNFDLLDSLLAAAKKRLNRQSPLSKFETAAFSICQQLLKLPSDRARKEYISKVPGLLTESIATTVYPIGYYELGLWAKMNR